MTLAVENKGPIRDHVSLKEKRESLAWKQPTASTAQSTWGISNRWILEQSKEQYRIPLQALCWFFNLNANLNQ